MLVSVVMTLARNLPPNAVRCFDGGVALNWFLVVLAPGSTSEVLNTVLIAGRPIWSPAIHALPFHHVVWPHTPILPPSWSSGTSITIAFVLKPAKMSVGLSPRPSVPMWNRVPTKPVRSKKNGSERTPAKTLPSPASAAVPLPAVEPEPRTLPLVSDRAFAPV